MRRPPDQRTPPRGRYYALRDACSLIGISFEQLQYCINIFVNQGAQHHSITGFLHRGPHRLPSVLAVDLIELPCIFPPSQPRESAIFYQVIRALIDTWYITEHSVTRQPLAWNEWRPTDEFERLATSRRPPSRRSQTLSLAEARRSHAEHLASITARAAGEYQTHTLDSLDGSAERLRHLFSTWNHAGWIRIQAFRAIAWRQNRVLHPFEAAQLFGEKLSSWMVAEKEFRYPRREREEQEGKRAVEEIMADMGMATNSERR
ncbi:MAG: hypothetical protein Q9165_001204 [Trypethelium subeluteriae]